MLAQDIVERIRRDFEDPDEADLALSVLKDFAEKNKEPPSDRVLRGIVFVANGDLDRLGQAIDLARIDYRDLIVWAEYDENRQRVRNLSTSFPS